VVSKTIDLGSNPGTPAKILKRIIMSGFRSWLAEVYDEMMNKVSWPTRDELQESTVVVLVSAIILSVCIEIIDLSTHLVLNFIYKI
jgi:preprotein translocase subunit SecE